MIVDKSKLKALAEYASAHADDSYNLPAMIALDRAATPSVILGLIAEIENIGNDRALCWKEFKSQGRKLDSLTSENEELRKDSVRLDWLDSRRVPFIEGQSYSQPEGELVGYEWSVFGQCSSVRDAIDDAMTREK